MEQLRCCFHLNWFHRFFSCTDSGVFLLTSPFFTERRVLQFIVIKESARFHSNSTCLLHRLRTVV